MLDLFYEVYNSKPELKVSAGGRINIIGEHIDYCGGCVFPAAIGLNNTIYAKKNGTKKIRIFADSLKIKEELEIDKLDSYRDLKWGNYQAGVAYMLQQAGYKLVGCDLLYTCSVPFGSGLSSSAAIEVSTAVILNEIAGNKYDLVEMALLSQKAENEYCGCNCGIMDQFASAMGKKDNAVLLNCKTLEYEYAPLELGDYTLVIANSNKRHTLNDGNYNDRRAEAEKATDILKEKLGISCLADLSVEQFEKVKDCLNGKVLDRATHVVYECDRVNKAVKALKGGDLVTLGKLINASHKSLSKLYEVTGFELDALASAGQRFEGSLGSRMIGGGFGGCTISIVKKDMVEEFIKQVGEEYYKAVGYKADFFVTDIAQGVKVTKI